MGKERVLRSVGERQRGASRGSLARLRIDQEEPAPCVNVADNLCLL